MQPQTHQARFQSAGTVYLRFWPTYHPAYLLRRRNDKALHAEAVWADLKRAVEGLR